MLIAQLILSFTILSSIKAYYVPANGDDWTQFKPKANYLPGCFTSLPFKFGIVVNPYILNNEGELLEPEITSITRSLTTSFVTSYVTAAPKPTKTKDIILQLQDGQVQKVNEELCDDKELKDLKGNDSNRYKGKNKGGDSNGYYSDDSGRGFDDYDRQDQFKGDKNYKSEPHYDDRDNDQLYDDRHNGKQYPNDDRQKKGTGKHRKGDDRQSNNDYRDGHYVKRNVHDLGGEYKDKPYDESSKHYHDKHSQNHNVDDYAFEDTKDLHDEYNDYYPEEDRKKSHKKRPSNHRGKYDYYEDDEFQSPVYSVACYTSATLRMSLHDSILRDSDDRIGCIVSGHQFQFDGPTPQHGAVYAAGWSVTKDGQLALGDCTKFWQCASGHFYNLYDQSIGFQCHPVTLDVVELIEC
ncbi:hypothetical protein KGF54_004462 [Candida jiufengensis]|uniref:uncharacterized protein n=1 Tax=Candida jiufengensis TaxID=497108 RepID=UPI002224882F|nr:uncharacterized protein KGF54_004462 [Candida jiufengensis]KAI5951388.1 hypothetical protein KGF54_004462 [Candida jiufengensis]